MTLMRRDSPLRARRTTETRTESIVRSGVRKTHRAAAFLPEPVERFIKINIFL